MAAADQIDSWLEDIDNCLALWGEQKALHRWDVDHEPEAPHGEARATR